MRVRKLSGIGPKAGQHLREVGVTTLSELARLDKMTAQRLFGKTAQTLLERAAGIDMRPVVCDDPVKSVSNEYTFSTDLTTEQEIRDALCDIAGQVGRRLRKKGLRGRCVSLKLRFGDFQTKSVSRTLATATDNEKVLSACALEMALGIWREGMGVRLLGIGVSSFVTDGGQMSLFADSDTDGEHAITVVDERDERLVTRLDDIRDKFGEAAVLSGRQLKQQGEDTPWKMRSETAGHNAHD
jgi:DNA polymerase-4